VVVDHGDVLYRGLGQDLLNDFNIFLLLLWFYLDVCFSLFNLLIGLVLLPLSQGGKLFEFFLLPRLLGGV